MKELVVIFIGGGLGSVLRYMVQMGFHDRIQTGAIPWATFAVNVVGSLLIGLFYALSSRFGLSSEFRLLLTTGLCGGFTTFSTFSHDGMVLLRDGFYGQFLAYVVMSVLLALAAVYAGYWLGKQTL